VRSALGALALNEAKASFQRNAQRGGGRVGGGWKGGHGGDASEQQFDGGEEGEEGGDGEDPEQEDYGQGAF